MSRIYLDACSIIYLVEAQSPFHATVSRRVLSFQSDAASLLVTSRLSCLECRIRPLRENNERVLKAYDAFFGASRVLIAEVNAEVIERATSLRARFGYTTPDAIHLASAVEESCELFLTGDTALSGFSELKVEVFRIA